jgi:hypothetical protein
MTHERDTSAARACDAAKVSHRIASLKVVASRRKASHRCIVLLRAAIEVTVFMVHRGDPMGGISSLLLEHASGMNLFPAAVLFGDQHHRMAACQKKHAWHRARHMHTSLTLGLSLWKGRAAMTAGPIFRTLFLILLFDFYNKGSKPDLRT